jgi:hypothetical protein
MAEEIAGAETVRVIDPDNVGEIFVTGGCNVSRAGNYIKILLTVSREDPEALMANRMQAPSLVVVSRAIMEAGTALALAQSILIQLGVSGKAPIEPDLTRN